MEPALGQQQPTADAGTAVKRLTRSLVEMVARDHGWENILESSDDVIRLGSARHRAYSMVRDGPAEDEWLVEVPRGRLALELARSSTTPSAEATIFPVKGLDALAGLLRRAAQLAQSLPDQAAATYAARIDEVLGGSELSRTEVERIVRQRVGQDVFRDALIDYRGGACAVTGLALTAVLRASHAKPWARCATDRERLDVFNGLLLSPQLDALFDRGLITFDDTGEMLVSRALRPVHRALLQVDGTACLRWVAPEHFKYLEWHRSERFTATEQGVEGAAK